MLKLKSHVIYARINDIRTLGFFRIARAQSVEQSVTSWGKHLMILTS